jgi:hypothetical protein
VRVSLGSSHISQNCLIDTGAPITLLPRGVGIMLDVGMPPEESEGDETILLLGGRWPCVLHTVTMRLPPFDDLEWEAPVRFSVREGLPYGLLGYEGFLNRWAVSFNAYLGYTVVESIESFDRRLPVDPWVEFQKDFDGWDRPPA